MTMNMISIPTVVVVMIQIQIEYISEIRLSLLHLSISQATAAVEQELCQRPVKKETTAIVQLSKNLDIIAVISA